MNVVAGNMKHAVGCTALRHKPDDAKGDNFNGVSVSDGSSVVICKLADQNSWALINTSDGRAGWIKTRNLHVQLVPPLQQTIAKVGKDFFVLQAGRHAVVGNTKHATDTRLRCRPTDENDFNVSRVCDMDKVTIIEATDDGEFALVKAVDHAAEGWIKTRNLHIQML